MSGWHTFTGTVSKIFAEYLDLERGGTLEAEPGGVYNIAPAQGHTLPDESGELVPRELPMPPSDEFKTSKPPAVPKQDKTPEQGSVPSEPVKEG
jgi:hypothetical protein